jgi:uncharacterized membrane protein YbhN (UPF0104 family)
VKVVLQLLASLVVVGLLLTQADLEQVGSLLSEAEVGWLVAAVVVRVVGLLVHDLRVWALLYAHHPVRFWRVVPVGFVAGMWNIVAPARAGDFLLVGLLARELKVRASLAVAVVGLVGFIEAVVFAVYLLVVLLSGAGRWHELFGLEQTQEAIGWVSLIVIVSVAAAVVATVLGRRLLGGRQEPERAGPIQLLRDTLVDTGDIMGRWKAGLLHTVLALVHILVFLSAVVLTLYAVHIEIGAPWLAAGGVLAVGALAGIVLPPALGANAAAAAVAVLAAFGIDDAHALAFAGVLWLVLNVPPVLLGIPPMWTRLGTVRALQKENSA